MSIVGWWMIPAAITLLCAWVFLSASLIPDPTQKTVRSVGSGRLLIFLAIVSLVAWLVWAIFV